MNLFVKQYDDPREAAQAAAHLTWLAELDSGVRLPALRKVAGHRLVLEQLAGRRPTPGDLPAIANALGKLHAAAHTRHLRNAALDQPYTTRHLTIPDFVTPRQAALARCPVPYRGMPAAIYKDANPRNFLLADEQVALVDFDDLTLAPFGYDLAKLITTTAMTHGHLDPPLVDATHAAYNTEAGDNACPHERLRAYAELHHRLTAKYLYHNGYRHLWQTVRPWPRPDPSDDTG